MTARQVFEATLIELSKIQAPSLKLYEFNYLFNKAINQYINKVYNVYDINQQTTDDLRVLKSTAYLSPKKVNTSTNQPVQNNYNSSAIRMYNGNSPEAGSFGNAQSYLSQGHSQIQSLHGATYEVFLPIDYLHMLNCVCIYYVAKTKDCWDAGSYIEVPALRLTADSWSQIVTDIYNRPSPMRPYYYIHNMNQNQTLPTDPVTADNNLPQGTTGYVGTDLNGEYEVKKDNDAPALTAGSTLGKGSNFQRTFTLELSDDIKKEISLVEKPTAVRIGNTSNVRCEIRYGKKLNKNQIFLRVA